MSLVLIGLLSAGCTAAIPDTPSSLRPVRLGIAATDPGPDDLVECRLNYGFGVECHLTDEEDAEDRADSDHGAGEEQDRDLTVDAEIPCPRPSGGEGSTREASADPGRTPPVPTDADRTDVTGAGDGADADRAAGAPHPTPGSAESPTDEAPATQAGIDVPADDALEGSAAGFFLLLVGTAILVASSWIAPLVAAPRRPWNGPGHAPNTPIHSDRDP